MLSPWWNSKERWAAEYGGTPIRPMPLHKALVAWPLLLVGSVFLLAGHGICRLGEKILR